eukprot:Rhum_TRINITY_DN18680_c0_g1::Rhum_TRINITY_DN18680_c0_g1_i1::g.168090::m.168090/K04460/PPP5C; serine/threonine-protein phosphatase 5
MGNCGSDSKPPRPGQPRPELPVPVKEKAAADDAPVAPAAPAAQPASPPASSSPASRKSPSPKNMSRRKSSAGEMPSSPRAPANVVAPEVDTKAAGEKLIELLKFVQRAKGTKNARKFARWAPFCEKFEHYLFTDVLRVLELFQEADIMSEDDGEQTNPDGIVMKIEDINAAVDEGYSPPDGWVQSIINNLKCDTENRKLPDRRQFMYLLKHVTELFRPMDSAVHINVPADGRLIVVGDIHGQLDDLLWILSEGAPSEKTHYLFNGDFVDRGPEQCEVLALLFALKSLYPKSVWLNRGNHEEHRVNKAQGKGGFMQVCINEYDEQTYYTAQTAFQSLPLAHIINDKIAVVHGGLPGDDNVTLSEIRKINRFRECPCSTNRGATPPATREERIFQALLWSDPKDQKSRTAVSQRGAGVWFNEKVTKDFLSGNGLEHLIRSHEVVSAGHRPHHDNKCITIFSASRYCGKDDNLGSFLILLPNLGFNFSDFYIRSRGNVQSLKDFAATIKQSQAEDDCAKTQTLKHVDPFAEDPLSPSSLLRDSIDQSTSAEEIAAVRKMALQRLGELIFMKRSQMLGMFQSHDPAKTSIVNKRQWISVMQAAIGESLPWYSLSRHLVVTEEHGRINYIRFLERFQNRLAESWMQQWAVTWMDYGRTQISRCAVEMQQMLKREMQEKSGRKEAKLSYNEVSQALKKSIPGLSMTEIYYLLLLLDSNQDGFVDADEWAEQMRQSKDKSALPIPGVLDLWDLRRTNTKRYDALFKELQSSAWHGLVMKDSFLSAVMKYCGSKADSLDTWKLTASSLVRKSKNHPQHKSDAIDLAILRKAVESLENERHKAKVVMDIIEVVTRSQLRLHDMFVMLDTDQSGGLSAQEFVKGLTACGIVESDEEQRKRARDRAAGKAVNVDVISQEDAESLWEHADLDKDQNLTWKEFFEALSTYDTWANAPFFSEDNKRAAAVRLSCIE